MIPIIIIIVFLVYIFYYRHIFESNGIIELFKSKLIFFLLLFLVLYLLRKRIFRQFFKVIQTDNYILNKNIIEEFNFLKKIKNITDSNNIKENYKNYVNYLYVEQNGLCNSCMKRLDGNDFNLDYKISFSLGGKDHISNMQILCNNCFKNKIATEKYLK